MRGSGRTHPGFPARAPGGRAKLTRMSELAALKGVIDAAFEQRAQLTPGNMSDDLDDAIAESLALLDSGAARVAEPRPGGWVVNDWLKKAVLLSFRTRDNELVRGGYTNFYDKVPLKYAHTSEAQLRAGGTRIVPHAIVRHGAYVAPNVVLMPSYVNIGAYLGSGTMAAPTIIEDDCFIGARSEIVEGVIVEAGSVISMGVFIGQSTRIYDRTTGQILRGRVPAGSVVVSGTLPAAEGKYSLYCAVIVKRVDAQTRAKTSINELLRSVDSA
jgi:2,3,4,5-tetrahydropyridine-2-carboxylate N-succinyltransferase